MIRGLSPARVSTGPQPELSGWYRFQNRPLQPQLSPAIQLTALSAVLLSINWWLVPYCMFVLFSDGWFYRTAGRRWWHDSRQQNAQKLRLLRKDEARVWWQDSLRALYEVRLARFIIWMRTVSHQGCICYCCWGALGVGSPYFARVLVLRDNKNNKKRI